MEWNYGDFIGEGWGFDWAYSRWQTPSPAVNASNVAAYADTLVAYAKQRAAVYQGPVLIPWGAGVHVLGVTCHIQHPPLPPPDFRFTDAASNFGNMSQILSHISQHASDYNVTCRYATLSDYFKSLHARNFTFPLQRGLDFEFGWPHVWGIKATGNKTTQYQTGAAVSRAAHKANIRATSRLHRAAESAQVPEGV